MHAKESTARHPYICGGIPQHNTLQHPGRYVADVWQDGPPRAPAHFSRSMFDFSRAACERQPEQRSGMLEDVSVLWLLMRVGIEPLGKKACVSATAQLVP